MSDLHCRDASAAMPLTSLAALAQTTEHCLGELAALLSEVESSGLSDSHTAALIDAARRLAQLQGALELIDQPGLAALTALVREQLINAGQPATNAPHPSRFILQRFQVFIRAALRALLRGQSLSTGELIHYWHQQLAVGGPSTRQASALLVLDIDQHLLSDLPLTELIDQAHTDSAHTDPDQLLLTLLRAQDDQALRAAVLPIAALFAAATTTSLTEEQCAYWLAIQACFIEFAHVGGDPTPIKKIAAAGVRLQRQPISEHKSSADTLGSLAREALYTLAQHPRHTTLALAVAKVFRLEQQFALPEHRIIADVTDENISVALHQALDVMISAIESNPASIEDPVIWKTWIDTALASEFFAPAAADLQDLLARIGSAPLQPLQAEGLAAGLCCLKKSTRGCAMLATIRSMSGLLSSEQPSQHLDQLSTQARADDAHDLYQALVATMQTDMAQVEHALEVGSASDTTNAYKTATLVMTRIEGALNLLGASAAREYLVQLRNSLTQFTAHTLKDETFVQQWVLLQTMLADLPWQLGLQAEQSLQGNHMPLHEHAVPIEQTLPIEQVASLEQIAPLEQTTPLEQATSLEQATPLEQAVPVEQAASLKQAAPIDQELPPEQVFTKDEALNSDQSPQDLLSLQPQPQLDAIFIDEARTLIHAMRDYAAAADTPGLSHATHTLAGCSATVGLSGLAELALALESALEHVQLHGSALSSSLIDTVLDALSQMLENFASHGERGNALSLVQCLRESMVPPTSDIAAGIAQHLLAEEVTPSPGPSEEHDELYELFKLEAADLLPQLEQSLRQWQQQPDDLAQAMQLLRVLHTLKGSARMAGRDDLGEEFHQAETEVAELQRQAPASLAPAILLPSIVALLHRVDLWTYTFTQPASTRLDHASVTGLSIDHIAGVESATDVSAQEKSAERSVLPSRVGASDTTIAPLVPAKEKRSQMLRVRADRLAQFADTGAELWSGNAHLGELLQVQRRSLTDLAEDISRLRTQLRELEIEAESRVVAHASQTAVSGVAPPEFDPLEFDRYTRLHELTRMMAESVTDLVGVQRSLSGQLEQLSNTTAEQQRDLRRQQSELQALRCQPLHTVETRLRHVLQHSARELGAEVELMLHNGDVEIERVLLDRLLGPLEHLLRNAVVHGIEPASQRQALGKPVTGRVTISATVTGNELQLVLTDDGRGLDFQRIRQRAIDAGLLNVGDDPDQDALSALIFAPGLSTATNLTALSGRGIGMDAVRAELTAMGGQIAVESEAGQGCRFTLRLPMGLASVMVVLARAGQLRVGLPAALVKQVLQIPADISRSEGQQQIDWQGTLLPLQRLGVMLGDTSTAPDRGAVAQSRVPVIIVSEGDQTMAIQLDAMEGQRELIVRHPGPQLSRVPGLAGASALADGAIVLVIHPFRLPDVTALEVSVVPEVRKPTVLVVDDSLTVRRASQRFLERHGYTVALARDGVEALAFLQTASVALVLLDIEMPRMDGFELLGILRDDARWRTLPVIMITSRMADRHRERALQLGATAYMGKPYSEQALLTLLTKIMAEPMPSATRDDQDFFTTA
ncbi:MAG: hypothetical protein RLZZ375_494 [Pseudomonadota bacterium]